MIPASELLAMQQEVTATLDLTADIQRNQANTIVIGQKTATWASILPGGLPVACSMRMPSQAIAAIFSDLIGAQQATVFTFAIGQDVKKGDRIIQAGSTWTVQSPLFPESNQLATQALATRMD